MTDDACTIARLARERLTFAARALLWEMRARNLARERDYWRVRVETRRANQRRSIKRRARRAA